MALDDIWDLNDFCRPPLPSDFHTHTLRSDGILDPKDLLKEVADAGIRVLAVTDHDNMNAVDEMEAEIESGQYDLKLVPGVEFSSVWSIPGFSCKIHIVGLFCDRNNTRLKQLVATHRQKRDKRTVFVRDKLLETEGMSRLKNELDDMIAVLNRRNTFINRKHFASFLVRYGFAVNIGEAMDKYLCDGCSAGYSVEYTAFDEVIKIILGAGGIPVLAHPLRYKKISGNSKREEILENLVYDFRRCGGQGIEITTPNPKSVSNPDPELKSSFVKFRDFTFENTARISDLAVRYDLLGSFGSDYHGEKDAADRFLGIHYCLPPEVKPVWTDRRFEGIYN